MFEIFVTIFIAARVLTYTFPETYSHADCDEKAKVIATHFNKQKKNLGATIECRIRDWKKA